MKLAAWIHRLMLLKTSMAEPNNNKKGKHHQKGQKTIIPKDAWKEDGYVEPVKKPVPYGKHQRDVDRYEAPKKTKCREFKNNKHSKKFDSTMGYPGEGPVTDCTEGVNCMIAGHYHRKKSPLDGAAKRKREQGGGSKPPRTIKYEKCNSIANIQCCGEEHAHDHTQCLDCNATRSFVSQYQDWLDSQKPSEEEHKHDSDLPLVEVSNPPEHPVVFTVPSLVPEEAPLPTLSSSSTTTVVVPTVQSSEPTTTINTQVYPKGEEAVASIVVAPVVKKVLIFTTAPSASSGRWIDLILNVFRNTTSTVENTVCPSELSANVKMYSTQESSFTTFMTGTMKWFGTNAVTYVEYFTKLYPTYYAGDVYQDCVDIALADLGLAKRRPVDPDGVITDVMTAVKHVVNTHPRAGVWIIDQRIYVNTLIYITNRVVLRGLLEAAANPKSSKTVFRSADLLPMSHGVGPLFA